MRTRCAASGGRWQWMLALLVIAFVPCFAINAASFKLAYEDEQTRFRRGWRTRSRVTRMRYLIQKEFDSVSRKEEDGFPTVGTLMPPEKQKDHKEKFEKDKEQDRLEKEKMQKEKEKQKQEKELEKQKEREKAAAAATSHPTDSPKTPAPSKEDKWWLVDTDAPTARPIVPPTESPTARPAAAPTADKSSPETTPAADTPPVLTIQLQLSTWQPQNASSVLLQSTVSETVSHILCESPSILLTTASNVYESDKATCLIEASSSLLLDDADVSVLQGVAGVTRIRHSSASIHWFTWTLTYTVLSLDEAYLEAALDEDSSLQREGNDERLEYAALLNMQDALQLTLDDRIQDGSMRDFLTVATSEEVTAASVGQEMSAFASLAAAEAESLVQPPPTTTAKKIALRVAGFMLMFFTLAVYVLLLQLARQRRIRLNQMQIHIIKEAAPEQPAAAFPPPRMNGGGIPPIGRATQLMVGDIMSVSSYGDDDSEEGESLDDIIRKTTGCVATASPSKKSFDEGSSGQRMMMPMPYLD